VILIEGENGSGKSTCAEKMIAGMTGRRYYLATMIPCGKEGEEKVKKHKDMRKDLHFETCEVPYEVGNVPVEKNSVVLLEDVSNLLANVLFEKKGNGMSVMEDIKRLSRKCAVLIVISISGLKEGGYEGETKEYVRELNALNENLRQEADTVIRMCRGIPEVRKGEKCT